jgi:hypothetical protein
MFDAQGAQLLTTLFHRSAHLRPADADIATLPTRGGVAQVGALAVGFEAGRSQATTRAWIFDGEGRGTTAHVQMERAARMEGPQRCADALLAHLRTYAPLLVANGLEVGWVVTLNRPDRFEVRLHNRQRTLSGDSAEQIVNTLGHLFHVLSGLEDGARSFSVEPRNGLGTRTVVAANHVDAAKFWMVMESLDVLRTRSVQPPAWIVEKHPMEPLEAELNAFRDGLPDLRILHRR